VTVLFADVKGSMELAEGLDLEEWHRIMDRFFTILAEGVHRFEGTVNQYTGDGIMALFGAPIAHEDHAQRACWAALHLGDALRRYANELRLTRGLSFAVRMGINSGEVVVGTIGDDLRMDYTAQGHTVGLAARMEQLAEPGKVYLSEHTAKLVSGLFRLEDLGRLTVKGVQAPLGVFALVGVGPLRTRLDVARTRGFSRFVGRADEMHAMEGALAQAGEGNGQVVGVVAEPGVGKSRICLEFTERCRARSVRVNVAHAVSHGKMIPYVPVLELLRGYFEIGDGDAPETARRKIAGTLLLLDRELEESLALVFDFLGVADPMRSVPAMDPEARLRRLFEVMRRIMHAEGDRGPGVVLIEDLHWLDPGSEAFLENAVAAVPGSRTLLLLTFRPEYHAGWMQRSYYRQLPLAPLDAAATAELLRDLLGSDASVAPLAELIPRHTGGNPFFVEEVVQDLAESGTLAGARGAYRLTRPVERLTIPPTVQAILAARIDRLADSEKRVLQTASVIGKQVPGPLLRRVLDISDVELAAAARALVDGEFLYEQALFPDLEYAFKHPLTQEVAYGSQLVARRAEVHRRVARRLAELYADRLDEQAALLAHHHEAAGDALEAARWHERAARWAATSDPSAAVRHAQRVRALLAALPEAPLMIALRFAACEALLGLWARVGGSVEEAEVVFAEGRTLAEKMEEPRALCTLILEYAAVRGSVGDTRSWATLGAEGASLAERIDEPALTVAGRCWQTLGLGFTGRVREALAAADEGLRIVDSAAGLVNPSLSAGLSVGPALLGMRGIFAALAGRMEEGAAQGRSAVALMEKEGATESLVHARAWLGVITSLAGDGDAALAHARDAVSLGERVGVHHGCVMAYLSLGMAHATREAWWEGVDALEHSLATARGRHAGLDLEARTLCWLARCRLGLGEIDVARARAEEAIALAKARGERDMQGHAESILAGALIRSEGARARARAQGLVESALDNVRESGALGLEPVVHEVRAELAMALGDHAGRLTALREAQHLYATMGAHGHAERVAREIDACT
jgi:class 3 adenylate cyclase